MDDAKPEKAPRCAERKEHEFDDLDNVLIATLLGLREKSKGEPSNWDIWCNLEDFNDAGIIEERTREEIRWRDDTTGKRKPSVGFQAMKNRMIQIRRQYPSS